MHVLRGWVGGRNGMVNGSRLGDFKYTASEMKIWPNLRKKTQHAIRHRAIARHPAVGPAT